MTFVLQVIGWILFLYGFFSLSQDVVNEFTYKKISHNMKIIILAKDLEDNMENFTKELSNLKRSNNYKEIVVVDLDDKDDVNNINNNFQKQEIELKLLNKANGKKYITDYFENENISFL